MDYSNKSDANLLQILEGSRGRLTENSGNTLARGVFEAAQVEALRRGLLSPRTKTRITKWTAADIEEILLPFTALTKSIPNNARLAGRGITHAGGLKLKGEMAINSYTAIKARGVDVVLVACAKEKGDVPYFILRERRSPTDKEMTERGRFTVANLQAEVLPIWQEFARIAAGRE